MSLQCMDHTWIYVRDMNSSPLQAEVLLNKMMDRSEPTQIVSGNPFKLVGRSTAGVHEKGLW